MTMTDRDRVYAMADLDLVAAKVAAVDRALEHHPDNAMLGDLRRQLLAQAKAIELEPAEDVARRHLDAYRRHLDQYVATGDPDHLAAMLDHVPHLPDPIAVIPLNPKAWMRTEPIGGWTWRRRRHARTA